MAPPRPTLDKPWSSYLGMDPLIDGPIDASQAEAIVWLDIDNTLYSHMETRIADLMIDRIRNYFMSLGLDEDEAEYLHKHYYKEYGLAIRGLVRHHTIDPLDYDQKCDVSLPLDTLLKPDTSVIQLLQSLDRRKTRVYALTNAYKVHARRVLSLVELETYVDAVVFCDYANPDFSCKPEPEFYLAAEQAVQASPHTRHYFVDDSVANVRMATSLGWHSCVLFDETLPDNASRTREDGVPVIAALPELRTLWSELFAPGSAS
ncbi:nucleotidase [Malassezia pachydermatis]|uniref:Pyrimidine 5-nucleotidase n=1 Tax=Malassezia pachydermatis TaxID=77020 RepID=A0A0M8MLY5_9BASI|nr:pyrimidine 5-nucleotidase [Malassezia pachydermatis]KOS12787.1 pyrimidine 5-nucleotidase [Malassezia pachydermatis]